MRNDHAGLTLLELLMVIVIISILAAFAAPSFSDYFLTLRVKGATEGLAAALQDTKAEAIKTNTIRQVVFTPSGTNTEHPTWCYGMGATTCDCTTGTDCEPGSIIKSTLYKNITVSFNNSNIRAFSPLRGSANSTQGTVTFSAGNNRNLGVVLGAIGSIRICKPTGAVISWYEDSGTCP